MKDDILDTVAVGFILLMLMGIAMMLRAFYDSGNPMAIVNVVWASGLIVWVSKLRGWW